MSYKIISKYIKDISFEIPKNLILGVNNLKKI